VEILQQIIMKKLQDYLSESEQWIDSPSSGDHFDIELEDDTLLETYVIGVDQEGGILLDSNEQIFSLLESWNMLEDDIDTDVEEDIDSNTVKKGMNTRSTNDLEEMAPLAALTGRALAHAAGSAVANRNNDTNETQDPGEYDTEGDMAKNELYTIVRAARKLVGMLDNDDNMPEWTQKKITKAADYVDTAADYIGSQKERGFMEQGVAEGSGETGPVARATLHRIMMRHPGMLAQHGPERVMKAVDDVADLVGDVDEIGTSDVSGWVNMVQEILDSLDQSVAEGPVGGEIDDSWMNDKHKEFYKRNPHFKRNNRDRVEVGSGTQLATRVDPAVKPAQVKKKPATPFGLSEAATMASVSKLLRHIERHHPTWFDDYGMGEVEDTVVDMAEQGTFSGMTVVDAAALVGQELESMYGADAMSEAEYQGRKVPLGKPMRGDVKKSKVYVRDPKTGNVKKVNFGDPNMKIKKSNPERRKSFRARHNCDNPGPRTKARYWSCRAW